MEELQEELNNGDRFKIGSSDKIFVVVSINKNKKEILFKEFNDLHNSSAHTFKCNRSSAKRISIEQPEYLNINHV